MGEMRNSILTEKEKELISQFGCDLQTGNHLLYPRSEEYWSFGKEFTEAREAPEPTEKQKEMLEYYHQCTDYHYWNNLPDEQKMF
jgi:hypothetical protein